MKLLSRQDSLSESQSSQLTLPLKNYNEIATMLSLQTARDAAATERMRTERKNTMRDNINSDFKDKRVSSNRGMNNDEDESARTNNRHLRLGGTTRRTKRYKHVKYFRIYPEESEIEKDKESSKDQSDSQENVESKTH